MSKYVYSLMCRLKNGKETRYRMASAMKAIQVCASLKKIKNTTKKNYWNFSHWSCIMFLLRNLPLAILLFITFLLTFSSCSCGMSSLRDHQLFSDKRSTTAHHIWSQMFQPLSCLKFLCLHLAKEAPDSGDCAADSKQREQHIYMAFPHNQSKLSQWFSLFVHKRFTRAHQLMYVFVLFCAEMCVWSQQLWGLVH